MFHPLICNWTQTKQANTRAKATTYSTHRSYLFFLTGLLLMCIMALAMLAMLALVSYSCCDELLLFLRYVSLGVLC